MSRPVVRAIFLSGIRYRVDGFEVSLRTLETRWLQASAGLSYRKSINAQVVAGVVKVAAKIVAVPPALHRSRIAEWASQSMRPHSDRFVRAFADAK